MGKMLEMPECDEADMYSELSYGRVPTRSASKLHQQTTRATRAFYDAPGLAGLLNVI
jgi:hypothetical protein